jgi:methionyl-tRNA synthetase
MSKKKYLVTSALPYINGIKHLGNLVGSMLPADVYARFQRAKGNDVLFICGTDEHGSPAEISAQKAGIPVREFCDRLFETQSKIYQEFNLSFDHFGRTSRPQNHELTQHFAKVLEEKGLIEERTVRQFFSIDDNRFLSDRFIEGTCPHCGYPNARGISVRDAQKSSILRI